MIFDIILYIHITTVIELELSMHNIPIAVFWSSAGGQLCVLEV